MRVARRLPDSVCGSLPTFLTLGGVAPARRPRGRVRYPTSWQRVALSFRWHARCFSAPIEGELRTLVQETPEQFSVQSVRTFPLAMNPVSQELPQCSLA